MCCSWTCLHHRGLSCTWTCLHQRASAAPGYVWTTGIYAAPGRVYITGAWTAPVVSPLQPRGLCCNWTPPDCRTNNSTTKNWFKRAAHGWIWTTGASTAPGRVYTTGPVLLLDMSGQQESVLLLDVSTPQGPELHLDKSTLQPRGLCCNWTTPDCRTNISSTKIWFKRKFRVYTCTFCLLLVN